MKSILNFTKRNRLGLVVLYIFHPMLMHMLIMLLLLNKSFMKYFYNKLNVFCKNKIESILNIVETNLGM